MTSVLLGGALGHGPVGLLGPPTYVFYIKAYLLTVTVTVTDVYFLCARLVR